MPKIQPEQKVKATLFPLRLRTDIQAQILAYGAYLNADAPSSKEYVVTELFREMTKLDREFLAYWEQHKDTFLGRVEQTSPAVRRRGKPPVSKSAA